MNKKQDETDLKNNFEWLRKNGEEYTQDESDLSDILGGERFSYNTRKRTMEALWIIIDYPEFKRFITPDVEKYFESYTLL